MKLTGINRNYYGYLFIAPFIIGFLILACIPCTTPWR
jgi:hypothetical protein